MTEHSQTASERAERKYHEEKCAGPEGHKRPIAKERVFLGTGFLSVSSFPFEDTDEQQGQEQGNDCRDYHLAPAFESFMHLTIKFSPSLIDVRYFAQPSRTNRVIDLGHKACHQSLEPNLSYSPLENISMPEVSALVR